VVNVGPDGIFVAVAVSYGFQTTHADPVAIQASTDQLGRVSLGQVTLDKLPVQALVEGLQLNPDAAAFALDDGGASAFSDTGAGQGAESPLKTELIPQDLADRAFQSPQPEPPGFSFLLSIVDTGTGRELQNGPMHSLASLGIANGERPFRPLAQPLAFVPRSTLRLQVIEQTNGAAGELDVVLIGYKALVGSGCPPEVAVAAVRGFTGLVPDRGGPGQGIIPFDYVTSVDLRGRPGRRVEGELVINTEGPFVATAIGYGLAVERSPVPISLDPPSDGPPPAFIDLNAVPLKAFPVDALIDGIRLRPELVRLAVTGGVLGSVLPGTLDSLFERLNRPEEVRFRYALNDTGSAHAWQNEPVDSVAGLGIANGKRPFKWLARPMVFAPRATLLIDVEEVRGRGRLYVAFHGYKLLPGAVLPVTASGHHHPRRHGR
jgi:hypothetical protein